MIVANLTTIKLSNKPHITAMPFLLHLIFIHFKKPVANNPNSTTTPKSEQSSKKKSRNIKLHVMALGMVNETCLF